MTCSTGPFTVCLHFDTSWVGKYTFNSSFFHFVLFTSLHFFLFLSIVLSLSFIIYSLTSFYYVHFFCTNGLYLFLLFHFLSIVLFLSFPLLIPLFCTLISFLFFVFVSLFLSLSFIIIYISSFFFSPSLLFFFSSLSLSLLFFHTSFPYCQFFSIRETHTYLHTHTHTHTFSLYCSFYPHNLPFFLFFHTLFLYLNPSLILSIIHHSLYLFLSVLFSFLSHNLLFFLAFQSLYCSIYSLFSSLLSLYRVLTQWVPLLEGQSCLLTTGSIHFNMKSWLFFFF